MNLFLKYCPFPDNGFDYYIFNNPTDVQPDTTIDGIKAIVSID